MPPLLPSPGKTGSPDRRPSDHESDDYVAQMRRFLVPEVDTPESSAPYSLCRLESMDRAQSAMFADAPPLECEPGSRIALKDRASENSLLLCRNNC